MALADKKVLMVLPHRDFQLQEYDVTRRVLESRGLRIQVATAESWEAMSENGRTVRTSTRLGDVKYWDYDAIVFVGGNGARQLADTESATKLAKDAEYKVLGAIGLGALVLARAGVVKNKRVTGDPAVADTVREKEGTYTAQPLEVADKMVTAMSSRYAEPFAQALLRVLEK